MKAIPVVLVALASVGCYSASANHAADAPTLPPGPPAAVLAAAPANAQLLGTVRIEQKKLWPASCTSLLAKEAGRMLGANALHPLPSGDLQGRGAVCAGSAFKIAT